MDDLISRQTVKEQMIKYGFHAPDMTVTEFVEDLLLPAQPKDTCEDCISRRAAISVANDFDATMIVRGLEKLPSVQPEQKIGQWLGTDEWYHKCSCCGEVFHFYYPEYTKLNKWNFCPRCGAKMESEDKA